MTDFAAPLLSRAQATPAPSTRGAPVPAGRFAELESIRGLAALLVMMYHIPDFHPLAHQWTWIRQGHLMVPLFFVLSGFVMYRAYDGRLLAAPDVGRFMALRLGRLYPVHLVFLLAFVAIEALKAWYAQKHPVAPGSNLPWSANDIPALLQHLTLTQAVLPFGDIFTFNVPSWSISTEFYTYMLFALCVWLLGSMRTLGYVALCAFGFLAQVLWPKVEAVQPLLICVSGFFLGTLVGWVAERAAGLPRAPASFSLAGLLLILLGISWPGAGEFAQLALIYAGTAAFILLLAQVPDAPATGWLRAPALQWLGARSYALYMCHAFVIWCATNAVRILLKRPEAPRDGLMIPQLGGGEAVGIFILVVLASLLLADATHRWIETPLRARTRRWLGRSGPAPLPQTGRP